ncbi:MAG: GGDEF domain-containing protein [Sphingobium sp.]|nr:MAG: GGDEF domain-containing protein [Sphingobium sp.]
MGDTAMHADVQNSGLTDRLARWARKLTAQDEALEEESAEPSPREAGNRPFSREIERRRQLYGEIGDFLFAHDLDLTPINFGLVHDYLTGGDLGIEKAVGAILQNRGRITNGWVEKVIAEKQKDEINIDSLSSMLDKVETNLTQFTELMDESRTSAKDYGVALQEQVRDMEDAEKEQPVLAKLIGLTRSMVEKTRQVEAQMRESQKQTRVLQQTLENTRKAAEQDHLTGLPNRRAFEARMREEVAQAQADGETLAVAFCDIDHFKLVNDTHGHDVGDRVLKFVSTLLAGVSGDKCHVARHGGEEFVMLFRGKSAAEACEIVDAAREDLSGRSLVNRTNGQRMERVTFSAGVANVFAYDDPRTALKAADRALYLAKEHGRNRVYMATEDV